MTASCLQLQHNVHAYMYIMLLACTSIHTVHTRPVVYTAAHGNIVKAEIV